MSEPLGLRMSDPDWLSVTADRAEERSEESYACQLRIVANTLRGIFNWFSSRRLRDVCKTVFATGSRCYGTYWEPCSDFDYVALCEDGALVSTLIGFGFDVGGSATAMPLSYVTRCLCLPSSVYKDGNSSAPYLLRRRVGHYRPFLYDRFQDGAWIEMPLPELVSLRLGLVNFIVVNTESRHSKMLAATIACISQRPESKFATVGKWSEYKASKEFAE